MAQIYSVLRTEEKTDGYREDIQSKLSGITADFAVLAAVEDVFPEADLQVACAFAQEKQLDAVMLECSYDCGEETTKATAKSGKKKVGVQNSGKKAQSEAVPKGKLVRLDNIDEFSSMPDDYDAVVYRKTALLENLPDPEHGYEMNADLFYRVAEKKMAVGYLTGTKVQIGHPEKKDISRNPDNRKADWYLDRFAAHCHGTLQRYHEKLPAHMQLHLVRELIIRFDTNKNHHDKHVLDTSGLREFYKLVSEVLQNIEDEWLISGAKIWKDYRLSFALQEKLLHLKYMDLQEEYILVDPEKENRGLRYPTRILINGRQMPNQVLPKVCLDVVNEEKDALVLDCSCPYFLKDSAIRWEVLWNKKPVEVQETQRYNETTYFGQAEYRGYTFRLILSKKDFQKKNKLQFVLNIDGKKIPHPIITRRFTSRITSKLNCSYWCFDHYVMTFDRGKVKRAILIEECSGLEHLKREATFWVDILKKTVKKMDTGRPEMLKERFWYWLSYPVYHKKNIWLTFDKIYKGGDCGEYFYKYCVSRKDTDVVPVYLMNEEAEDTKRLRQEGYRPLIHGTRKHRCIYLHAKMVFATHAGLYNFNGISDEEIPYLQDLISADAVCIQHGLTVQDLAFNANQAFNNNKLYYCASKYEVQNLLQPQYGYQNADAIRLKGLARFDGLINRDQKQILITPTWRNYIALWPNGKNESRPYSELFKKTDYYKIYNRLITDDKLLETARRTGYKLIYLVHPNIGEQAVDFEKKDGVEIISALGVNYEKILCESSLMLTDYSGVQFDFAYMRKPVVYYHPPKLPPHYVEGGFFYDTQGFGEICTEHQQLVDTLCDYMEHDCQLKDFYRTRQDDFFAFSDHDNCKRIFEDAYTWQKENR